jgi:hypothetical protein
MNKIKFENSIQHLQRTAAMPSYEQRVSLLEFLYRKPGVSLTDVPEDPETLECLLQDVFDDLRLSKARLREQVTGLEAHNRELEEYAHMVAHDLKEPLTVLILTTDMIKDIPDLTGEELKEYLLQIKSTANEMRSIVKNLLLFSQVTRAEVPRESVQMDQVVANVQARLSYLIRERQAQVILPPRWPDAVGYGPWIEEVWANLLSNALKYGGEPPRVELGASPWSEGMLRFWTRDNARASRRRPIHACLHAATHPAASVVRETGWVCQLCTTSSTNWVVRLVSRAKKVRAVSFSLPCRLQHRTSKEPCFHIGSKAKRNVKTIFHYRGDLP